ncbi:MAG TPA: alpha-amylase family protein [Arachnia sp.]|nr:alpha-amylase family protein [Arachnia sp.]HMT85871.1 alpha-amylase family protein [Arachnia sp.]
MSWSEHAIWWHVYPLGACGAPIRDPHPAPGHRLTRLLNWLDYAAELGTSGLLLGPVFQSSTHGYDSTDQFRIDPRLGDEADFAALVDACHARGLAVVLDGVFSHVGRNHPAAREALAAGPGGRHADLFDIDWQHPDGPQFRVFEGHGSLVRLNHASPQARDYTVDVMRHWLALGADGWRLDAAYSVDAGFWADVLPRVRAHHPRAWFLGEVIHGDYAAFVRDSGVDTVTQYELWKAIWSSLKESNFFELDWTLSRHNDFLHSFVPQTFLGNHDVTRIASTVGPERAVLALAILMTVGGIPSIYYGDEQGATGVKEERADGDDAVRPPLPESPAELLPFGRDMFRAHQALIGLRRRHPWLVRATTKTLALTNTHYVYQAEADGNLLTVELLLDGEHPVAVIRDDRGAELWSYGRSC